MTRLTSETGILSNKRLSITAHFLLRLRYGPHLERPWALLGEYSSCQARFDPLEVSLEAEGKKILELLSSRHPEMHLLKPPFFPFSGHHIPLKTTF